MEFMEIAIIAGAIIGLLIFIGLIMACLFKRTSRETNLVKTGSGSKKVITDGGTIVLPFLHEIAKVNMKEEAPAKEKGVNAVINRTK